MRKLLIVSVMIFLVLYCILYERIKELAFESRLMIMFLLITIPSIFLGIVWSLKDSKNK